MAMMGKVRKLFDWIRPFPWTIGGMAYRDGRRGIPRPDGWREIQAYAPDTQQAGRAATPVMQPQLMTPGDGRGVPALYVPRAAASHPGDQPAPQVRPEPSPVAQGSATVPSPVPGGGEMQGPEPATGPAVGARPQRPRLSYFEHILIDLINSKITEEAETWEKARHALKARLKLIRQRMQALLEEYGAACQRHRAKAFRNPSRMPWWLYPLFAFTGVAETAFNAGAFLIFRLPVEEQYAIAASASVIILMMAKQLGIRARQLFGAATGSRRLPWGFLALAAFMLLTQLAVAVMREQYIAWAQKVEVDPIHVLLLFVFGLLIPLGPAIAVFQYADPDPELGDIVLQKARCRQRLENSWTEWNHLAARYETLRALTRVRVERLQEKARSEIDEYRHFNVSARGESGTPPWHFQEAIADVLFRPVDLGPEIDLTPPPLDELLESSRGRDQQEPRHDH